MPRAQRQVDNIGDCGIMTEADSFISLVGIGSETDCLLGLLNKMLETSDSEAGLKTMKSEATGGEGECGK